MRIMFASVILMMFFRLMAPSQSRIPLGVSEEAFSIDVLAGAGGFKYIDVLIRVCCV